jgi:hypothetical protein
MPVHRPHRVLNVLLLAVGLCGGAGCTRARDENTAVPAALGEKGLRLTSSAFAHHDEIPKKYTCQGADVPLPLAWTAGPEGTRSFVLIMDDPDVPDPKAPRRTYVHWVLYNLPAEARELPEGTTAARLPAGTLEGRNDWERTGYGGPCPPIGRHRYFHKLYALDTTLPDLGAPIKAALEKAMEGHVIARAELIGTYER